MVARAAALVEGWAVNDPVFILIGKGTKPHRFRNCAVSQGIMSLRGFKGTVIDIHLFGDWWEIITPDDLRSQLIGMRLGNNSVRVTLSE